ncbi:MAG: sulfatase-like hydrolase/transferase [Opitutaceae bacterium]|nr:sulfatase-like hydrolase/transferase [Opitutaceae bacterium]
MPRPPNLLLIWTDQQRNDTLPCHGNTFVQAPALKQLGEESFVFRRAYCTQPVCTPSRGSILTGLWPHTHGCVNNNLPLRPDTRTLAELLPAGYARAYYGKWHLGSELNAQHGFTDWRSIEDGIYRDFYADPADRARRSSYHDFLLRHGFVPDTTEEDGAHLFSRSFTAVMPERFTKSGYLAGEAERFLQAQRRDQPFFLSVNFLEPHPPPFGPYNDLYDPASLPVGPAFMVPPGPDASAHARRVAAEVHDEGFKRFPFRTPADARRLAANYYGLVTLVDRAVGRILAALDAAGLAEDTLVVFTSDHGEQLGDHALVQKGTFYEQSTRIPLMLRVPWLGRRQVMLDGPVSQVDLVPTLLELMGLDRPAHLQGRSLAEALRDPRRPGGDVVVEWNDAKRPDEEGRCLVTPDGWKLNRYRSGHVELYDLNADAAELRNLAAAPAQAGRVRELTGRLRAWQQQTGDPLAVA